MRKTLYKILGLKEDSTFEEIKHAFRDLAKRYHPDATFGDKKAEEHFKEISAAYEVLSDPKKRAQYDKSGATAPAGAVVVAAKSGRYTVQDLLFSGDVADIYEAVLQSTGEPYALKIARSYKDNDLLENEAKVLSAIYPRNTTAPDGRYHLYLPRLQDSLKVDDGSRRHANILSLLHSYYSLEKVLASHPRLQLEHGVWIFNRILEILGYLHTKKSYVHGAILPTHVLVFGGKEESHPLNHGARLVGWSYSVPMGQSIRAISSRYENFYPPEVLKKAPATAATDIYMAAKSIIHVLGGEVGTTEADKYPAHIPNYFLNFLRACTFKSQASRPQSAWELHQELKEHMHRHYGPKKYVPFHMPLPA